MLDVFRCSKNVSILDVSQRASVIIHGKPTEEQLDADILLR